MFEETLYDKTPAHPEKTQHASSIAPIERIPSIGSQVDFVLPAGTRNIGQERPGFIVRVWDTAPTPESMCQIQVLTDGTNDFSTGNGSSGIYWATSVHHDAVTKAPGTFHYPYE